MANICIAGHFGCGNLGDDAIMLGLVEGLRAEDFDYTVLSGAPEETYRNYGLRSVPRKEMGPVKDAIAKCDALVFAGGSVFQDASSVRSSFYYANLVSMAKKLNKRVALVGQGVGPLTHFLSKRASVGAFNAADVIVVRDPSSANTLRELGVKKGARVGADLAFLLPKPRDDNDGSTQFGVGNMKTIGISPRPLGKSNKEMVALFGETAKLLYQNSFLPVLIEMDRNYDGPLIQEISKVQGGKIPDIRKLSTPMQLQSRLARMEAVIAMRLHAGILAATVNVPAMMVSYDPKVTAFAKLMDQPSPLQVENLTAQRLVENFMTFFRDRERQLRILERKNDEMRKLAEVNVEAVRDCVKAGATR